jgi:hypothetical protein
MILAEGLAELRGDLGWKSTLTELVLRHRLATRQEFGYQDRAAFIIEMETRHEVAYGRKLTVFVGKAVALGFELHRADGLRIPVLHLLHKQTALIAPHHFEIAVAAWRLHHHEVAVDYLAGGYQSSLEKVMNNIRRR